MLVYFYLLECLSQRDCRAALFEGHYRKELCNQFDSRLTLQTEKIMLTVLVLFLYWQFIVYFKKRWMYLSRNYVY